MPSGGPTYRGILPTTDEAVERLINACLLYLGSDGFGVLRTTLYDTNGDPVIFPTNSGTFVSGFKSLSSAGTAVQVLNSNVTIKYVDISVFGGTVAVGPSNVVATDASEVGNVLYPGNLPFRMLINNINLLYAAGASGTRVGFTYYV